MAMNYQRGWFAGWFGLVRGEYVSRPREWWDGYHAGRALSLRGQR